MFPSGWETKFHTNTYRTLWKWVVSNILEVIPFYNINSVTSASQRNDFLDTIGYLFVFDSKWTRNIFTWMGYYFSFFWARYLSQARVIRNQRIFLCMWWKTIRWFLAPFIKRTWLMTFNDARVAFINFHVVCYRRLWTSGIDVLYGSLRRWLHDQKRSG